MPPTAMHQQDNSYGGSAIWRVSKFVIPLIMELIRSLARPLMCLLQTKYINRLKENNESVQCSTLSELPWRDTYVGFCQYNEDEDINYRLVIT